MDQLCIRNRLLSQADLEQIRQLIASEGERGRTHLSQRLCRLWNWRQANGHYREIACRDLLRQLDRKGYIQLPAPKVILRRPGYQNRLPEPDEAEPLAVEVSLKVLRGQLEVLPVSSSQEQRTYKKLIGHYHYLGYRQPTGPCLKYIAWWQTQPLGCLSFGPAAWKVAVRDQWIGWPAELREKRLARVVNNDRFLILPWAQVRHLASFVLAAGLRRLATDWWQRYCYRPILVESFVQCDRFTGSSYAAANWRCIGQTRGRGRNDRWHQTSAPLKSVWLYPLQDNYREVLTVG